MTNFKTLISSKLLLCVLLAGCVRTHEYKFTSKVCDARLFVEVYQANPFGLYADYLTDSINFTKYIGDWDNEHETYSYSCKGDSIYIIKTVRGNKWARWDTTANGMRTVISNLDTIENFALSIPQLKTQNNFK